MEKEKSLIMDIWGGLAAMLVALPSSVAFGILVYTAIHPDAAGQGAMAGLLGAAALGLVTPLIGKTKGLISAPCAPSAAVLSALVLELVKRAGGSGDVKVILPFLAVTALLSALLQVGFGLMRGGRLIKFIPYQVVTGYLSGVGLIIAMSQLPKLLGTPRGVSWWQGLQRPELWNVYGILVGLVTMLVMVLAPRVTKRIPAAILGLISGIGTYFLFSIFVPVLGVLDGNALVIGPLKMSGSFVDQVSLQLVSLLSVDYETLKRALVPAGTLAVLLSIDTLKTCVGLDAMTRSRHNSDRELIGQGIGNLVSFLIGGMPGAGTMGPTLVNVSSGGHTPRAGLIEGVFVLLAVLFLSPLIAWVPIAALAGILLVIAWRMFDKSIFHLLRSAAGRFDFAVIAGVIVVAVTVDLIAAAGTGIGLAILLFIREQIKGSVILQKLDLSQTSSTTQRQEEERTLLHQFGHLGLVCKLQGNLFFGTTDQLYSQLLEDLKTKRFVLFDLRRVQSVDYTAVHLFEQMSAQLADRDGCLLFSGMPSSLAMKQDFEKYFMEMGLISGQRRVKIFETMDSAVEWMEDELLSSKGIQVGHQDRAQSSLMLAEFSLFRQLSKQTLQTLETCVSCKTYQPGEKIFSQGEEGDELFLVRRGAVRVQLPLLGGKYHHLATIGRNGFFGELSFLDHDRRTADVVAKTVTEIYALSRKRFNEQSLAEPSFGAQVFARLALVTAQRLRTTDAELSATSHR